MRPGAVRIGASSADGDLEVTAFRNANDSVAVVALNPATTAQAATFSLQGAGGFQARPYLTDATHDTPAQPAIPVTDGSFTATLPARALVTYYIPGS